MMDPLLRLAPVLVLALSCTTAQAAYPCYVDPIYTQEQIAITKDVPYGSAFDNESKAVEVLTLDAYLPPSPASAPPRPVVVLIHGGSFVAGNSESDDEPNFALEWAKRG